MVSARVRSSKSRPAPAYFDTFLASLAGIDVILTKADSEPIAVLGREGGAVVKGGEPAEITRFSREPSGRIAPLIADATELRSPSARSLKPTDERAHLVRCFDYSQPHTRRRTSVLGQVEILTENISNTGMGPTVTRIEGRLPRECVSADTPGVVGEAGSMTEGATG